MSMWSLSGVTPGYFAGVSGTVTLPADATILQIIVHSSAAGGSCSIFGGPAIPVINGAADKVIDFHHRLFAAQGSGAAAQIVFANCDSYFVHYCRSGNL